MKCRNCGLEHPGHVMCNVARAMAAREAASNSTVAASNTVEVASNTASNAVESASNAESAASNKKQRWGKAAYNAYMRDYMRKRRNG